MTISLFSGIGWSFITDAPVVAAEIRVAMTFPEKVHPMIHDIRSARPAHQMGDRERMDDSGGCEEVTGRRNSGSISGRRRTPFIIEVVKSAERVNNVPLKKRENVLDLLLKPRPMAWQRRPSAAWSSARRE